MSKALKSRKEILIQIVNTWLETRRLLRNVEREISHGDAQEALTIFVRALEEAGRITLLTKLMAGPRLQNQIESTNRKLRSHVGKLTAVFSLLDGLRIDQGLTARMDSALVDLPLEVKPSARQIVTDVANLHQKKGFANFFYRIRTVSQYIHVGTSALMHQRWISAPLEIGLLQSLAVLTKEIVEIPSLILEEFAPNLQGKLMAIKPNQPGSLERVALAIDFYQKNLENGLLTALVEEIELLSGLPRDELSQIDEAKMDELKGRMTKEMAVESLKRILLKGLKAADSVETTTALQISS